MGGRGAGVLLVDDDAAVAGDELCVHDVDVAACGGGDWGREAFDESGEEGFGVGESGEGAFVYEVEGRAGFLSRGGVV